MEKAKQEPDKLVQANISDLTGKHSQVKYLKNRTPKKEAEKNPVFFKVAS